MKMLTLALILAVLVSGGLTQEEFYKKYAFTKVMSECLGGDIYYGYLQQVANARRVCGIETRPTFIRPPIREVFTPIDFSAGRVPHVSNEIPTTFATTFPPLHPHLPPRPGIRTVGFGTPPPTVVTSVFGTTESVPIFSSENDLPFGPRIQSFRQKRGLVYNSKDIRDAQMRVETMIGNFTCVLRNLGVINSNLDIDHESLSDNIVKLPIASSLKSDLVGSLDHCRDKTLCLPVEKLRSPVPHQLQRLIEFVKCEKDGRFSACLKHDLRKNLNQFNLNLLPRFAPGSDDAETLLSLLVGAESAFEMELI